MLEEDNEQTNANTCCYKEPKWSGVCSDYQYGLDILKNGVIIDNIKLTGKGFFIIGRYKTCDLIFEHPSLSRFHSVLQYCSADNNEKKERGWYLMDLDSTHGTILNKKRIPSHTFVRIHTGHVIKFGGSTRLYIVTGPEEDKEELSRYTWTELMEIKNNRSQEKVADASGYLPVDSSKDNSVCMWGMSEIADEEESNTDTNSGVKYKHEDRYRDDPKKVLKVFFEREMFDESPQYEFSKVGFNKNICTLELPVFGENGEKVVVEVSGSDKKKDLITRCALEACRILDEMDELYKAGGSGRRPKKDNKYYEAKDYYSSEEDDFLDRTGQIEEKRIQRMRRFGVLPDTPEESPVNKIDARSSDSALVKFSRLEEINEEILDIEDRLEEARKALDAGENCNELDEIEKYLEAIQSGTINKQMRLKLRAKLFELTKEENLLRKQLKLSIPVTGIMRKSLYNCKERREKSDNPDEPGPDENPTSVGMNTAGSDRTALPRIGKVAVQSNITQNTDEIENDSDDNNSLDQHDESITTSNPESVVDGKRKSEEDEETVAPDSKRSKLSDDDEIEAILNWVPPPGQTGDGRTYLNDQYGY